MATVNVYVPDEMKARLEETDLNLSAVARECWESAVARAELPADEFALDVIDGNGIPVELQFTGSHLVTSPKTGAELYRTVDDDLVSVDEESRYFVAPVSEVTQEFLWNLLRDGEAVADVCVILEIRRVVRL